MAVLTNNNRAIVDQPAWEQATALAAGASAAGQCFVSDGANYIYHLFSATSFWRYSATANSWQQLASPPGGTVGIGTAMIYDTSRGSIWALISNGVAAPTWQEFTISTLTWSAAKSVVNLPATFGTDASLSHPDTTVAAAASDDFIYLVGNNATVLYRYTISTNAWDTGRAAVTAAPGAGAILRWLWGSSVDFLYLFRGAATSTVYRYQISTNAWTTVSAIPITETFTTGTMGAVRADGTKLLIQKDATMRLYQFDPATNLILPYGYQFLFLTSTAHVGDRFTVIKDAPSGMEFMYINGHTVATFARALLFF